VCSQVDGSNAGSVRSLLAGIAHPDRSPSVEGVSEAFANILG